MHYRKGHRVRSQQVFGNTEKDEFPEGEFPTMRPPTSAELKELYALEHLTEREFHPATPNAQRQLRGVG